MASLLCERTTYLRRWFTCVSMALAAGTGLVIPATSDAKDEPQIKIEEVVPTISWKDAEKFAGREVFAVGKIVRANRINSGHAFLNFAEDYRGTLTIFIRNSHYDNFPEPPEKKYEGKMVKVRGYVYMYNDSPNIGARTPDAIEILPDDTPLPESAEPKTVEAKIHAPDVLKIASYNVLNLFDAVDDPYHNDNSTGPKPRAEMERVAKQIRELDADIVALQEVENRGYLERFVSVFLADMGYQVVLFEGNDKRGIDVAVLSRLPVGPVTSYRHVVFPGLEGEPMRMRRDLIQVLIEPTNGDPFDVFVVHLKSKGGAPDGGREIRLPESRNVRAILEDILKDNSDARFVICGDFNDTLDSEAVQTIIGHGATALTQFVGDLTPNTPATYNKEPYLSTIDFIFASPEMAKQYVDDSYKVMPGSVAKTGSDHNAVVAKFRVK